MSDPTDASAWVKKAEHDLLSVANNLASKEIPWDKVVFDAQQAAEKFLKAVRSKYPGDEEETAREDAEKGVQIARRIRTAILERLEPEAP